MEKPSEPDVSSAPSESSVDASVDANVDALKVIIGDFDKGSEALQNMLQSIRNLKEAEACIIEVHEVMARLKFNKFQQLIQAGFSTEQALELCKDSTDIW